MSVIPTDDGVDAWLYSRNDDTEKLRKMLVPARDDLLVATPLSLA